MRKNDKAQQRSVSDNLSISPSPQRNSMENNELNRLFKVRLYKVTILHQILVLS